MASDNGTNSKKICEFPDCGRPARAKGLCASHYSQRRQGKELTPLYATRRPKGSPPRILYDEAPCPRADLPGPCHIFRGGKCGGKSGGYGTVGFNGKIIRVHRYVYERDVGPIPPGMEIDHQCRVRACCNVQHLRVVDDRTQATENVVGSGCQLSKAKTHCPKGHEYSPENTYVWRGMRDCRECSRIRDRARTAKKRKLRGSCVVS